MTTNDDLAALIILAGLRDSLPTGHPELPGVIRAIEVLRADVPDLDAEQLSRLAEYAGEVINALADTIREDPSYDSNTLSLARAAEAVVDRCRGWARCEVCGGTAPTDDEIRHSDEDCFK